MWLFTKNAHLSIGQHAGDPDSLVVHAQLPEDIDSFVAVLNEAGEGQHEAQDMPEGDYRYHVVAKRTEIAAAVARMVSRIDYAQLAHSFRVDFGTKPGCLLWVDRGGVQLAKVRE
jgi:hypothetical protein